MARRRESILKWTEVTRKRWISALARAEYPQDQFAKTFLAKANMMDLWPCLGLADDSGLAGAIAWTVTKQRPHVANLQLLHTFSRCRRLGVATRLCYAFLDAAEALGADYFRVSAEPPARAFYESLGVRFLGRQKSGCLLAVGRLGRTFRECVYDLDDETIWGAVTRKGKGGCVEVFPEKKKKPRG